MADEETTANAAVDTSSLATAVLPVASLREALPHLRRPFTPEAIKFKVQSVFRGASGCMIVSYVDARLVIERLNAVCGEHWTQAYRPAGDKHLFCDLTVFGVTRCDVGQSPKGFSKDLVSDALKRSAVLFGVGVSVYGMRQVKAFAYGDDGWVSAGRLEQKGDGDKKTLALTEKGHTDLRASYRKWLDGDGQRLFGDQLDHGDEAYNPSADEDEGDESFTPEAPAQLEDERAVELVAECGRLYAAIHEANPEALPQARYRAWLEGAWHSHAELERLVDYLTARLGQVSQVAA